MRIQRYDEKFAILKKKQPFYVIMYVGEINYGEYVETPPSNMWTIMHSDWMDATWFDDESQAREEIADRSKHLYHVIKITVNTEDISI